MSKLPYHAVHHDGDRCGFDGDGQRVHLGRGQPSAWEERPRGQRARAVHRGVVGGDGRGGHVVDDGEHGGSELGNKGSRLLAKVQCVGDLGGGPREANDRRVLVGIGATGVVLHAHEGLVVVAGLVLETWIGHTIGLQAPISIQ